MAGKPRSRTILVKLALDVVIAVATLALLSVPLTGLTVHEWLGLAVAIPLVLHLLLSWQWIVTATTRFLGRLPGTMRLNYVLNWVLFVTMTAVIVSGLLVSEVVLPALGVSPGHVQAMRPLHSLSADLLLVVVGLHLALNWRWVVTVTRRHLLAPWRAGDRPAAVPVPVERDRR